MLYYIMQQLSFALNSLNDIHQTDTDIQVPIEVDHIPLEIDYIQKFPNVLETNCWTDPGETNCWTDLGKTNGKSGLKITKL